MIEEETYDGWPCPWMPALVKKWAEEDMKSEEMALLEIINNINNIQNDIRLRFL